MKKILLILVAIVIIIIAVMLGLGLGFGKGSGDGNGEGKANAVQEVSKIEEITEKELAEDDDKGTIMKISVVGNEYFYENERILLEDFISKVKEIEGNLIVEVKDDKASLKAYNRLIDQLDELKISITEK